MAIGRFLGGVAVHIHNPVDNTYLVVRRSAAKDVGAGHWECITGRVDQGEGFYEAALREVAEESGLRIVLDFLIGTSHFYRGAHVDENELIGVHYHATLLDSAEKLQISVEHDAYDWLTSAEIVARFGASNWLSRMVTRAELMKDGFADGVMAALRQDSAET
ncbi:MAG: NUDIX domain-containing protein [Anaerolineae bacterium]|nr:NUDIX domain-containing protein [Anaerolineae bacterium]